MNVTRDVVYDLLPAYFSGEASADTRALVEEFFSTDPELRRMAERFRALADRPRAGSPDTEWARFNRLKTQAQLRQAAFIWVVTAFVAFGVTLVTGLGRFGYLHPGLILGIIFSVCAAGAWLATRSDAGPPNARARSGRRGI